MESTECDLSRPSSHLIGEDKHSSRFQWMCVCVCGQSWRSILWFRGWKVEEKLFPDEKNRFSLFWHTISINPRKSKKKKKTDFHQWPSHVSLNPLRGSKATCDLWYIYRSRTKIQIYRYTHQCLIVFFAFVVFCYTIMFIACMNCCCYRGKNVFSTH